MKVLFHCTKAENLISIKRHGLIPQIGERSEKLNESPGVFLFSTYEACEAGLENWLLDEFEEDDEIISLKIVLPDEFELETSVEYEQISRVVIPSEYIKFNKIEG